MKNVKIFIFTLSAFITCLVGCQPKSTEVSDFSEPISLGNGYYLREMPKNRKQALVRWNKICDQSRKINDKKRVMASLLNLKPFSA